MKTRSLLLIGVLALVIASTIVVCPLQKTTARTRHVEADPSLVALDITRIPAIMRSSELNWPKAATLMEKWFSAPATIAPRYRPSDTTTIKMDWVLGFARARTVYDRMIRDRIWVNPEAKTQIEALMRRKGYLVQANNEFNVLDQATETVDPDYIQHRPVEYDLTVLPDESVGALGRFVFRVLIAGSVRPTTIPMPRGHLVTINEIGIYVYDSYDFEGNQPLGCWNPSQNVIKLVAEPGWECVSNLTFRNYRGGSQRGGDFKIFSDIKRVRLTTPDTFVIRETR